MAKQLTLLLDTNVLIPLQDSYAILGENLANFHRLALIGGHQLRYHPASIADFERDSDLDRRARNLQYIRRFPALDRPAKCLWNTPATSPNDACDNEILYALECDAAHALVTEDKRLLTKARVRGLGNRTYSIQTAEDWLRRLHQPHEVSLPNIDDVPLHSLTPELPDAFFDSLREGYAGFSDWFRMKARENRRAWVYRDEGGVLGAICVYDVQTDEEVTDDRAKLDGKALKLCTFKVGQRVRGRKIGELFLKAAFRYGTENVCQHIFIHADVDKHNYLVNLLIDFGFEDRGTYRTDRVFVKQHPVAAPDDAGMPPLEYVKRFYPHYQAGTHVRKFLVPIQQGYHRILFPGYDAVQSLLFVAGGSVGNAIKLAYLCHAASMKIRPGDVLLFYRTEDEQAVTSLGVVDQFAVLDDAAKIAALVSRRTVYSIKEIESMVSRPTKVILFRLVKHLAKPVSYQRLQHDGVVTGPIQSISNISDDKFSRVLAAGGHRAILLSVKPRFAELILSRVKKVEFRRTWAAEPVGLAVIYSSSPVQRIVGIVAINGTFVASPTKVWTKCLPLGPGLQRKELMQYFAGKDQVYGVMLGDVALPSKPVPPKSLFKGFRPPQSYRYLSTAELRRVGKQFCLFQEML